MSRSLFDIAYDHVVEKYLKENPQVTIDDSEEGFRINDELNTKAWEMVDVLPDWIKNEFSPF